MRKDRTISQGSEDAISFERALELLSELRARVKRLEQEVYPYGVPDLAPSQARPRKGRKPKLESGEVSNRRKRLAAWLEQNWPRLLVPMRTAERTGDPSIAIAALIAAKAHGIPGVFQPPFYKTPEAFQDDLASFFRSGRYHGSPRNLAAAMAGVPQLKWKTSFDICIAHPYKTGHALEALWDYMRRNFPDRLRELEEARTELDVKIVLARSRTDDPLYLHLKKNPDRVKEWLEAGKPVDVKSRLGG